MTHVPQWAICIRESSKRFSIARLELPRAMTQLLVRGGYLYQSQLNVISIKTYSPLSHYLHFHYLEIVGSQWLLDFFWSACLTNGTGYVYHGDPSASASQSAGIISLGHYACLIVRYNRVDAGHPQPHSCVS